MKLKLSVKRKQINTRPKNTVGLSMASIPKEGVRDEHPNSVIWSAVPYPVEQTTRTTTKPATGIRGSSQSDSPSTGVPLYRAPNFGNPHLVMSWKKKF